MSSRRTFIQHLSKASLASLAIPSLDTSSRHKIAAQKVQLGPDENALASNERFWHTVQQAYTCSPNLINLNNGGVSPQVRAVQQMEEQLIREANQAPAYIMWRIQDKDRISVKRQLAELAGAAPTELALLRNATEALENLLFGFDLKPGDEVITTNQDYPSMLAALAQRERRDGIVVKKLSIPVPLSDPATIVERYAEAITPKTKLILVCHMINLTGQVLPVRAITDLGRANNIPVVVDGAHTFGQIPFTMDEIGADYFGTSLHKWLCGPFGTGLLYIRESNIGQVWPLMGSAEEEWDSITKFEHIGTRSIPTELAIGEAIAFHNTIGTALKANRLQYLTDYWVKQVVDLPGVHFNTAFDPGQYGAIANFYIDGITPQALQQTLFRNYRLFTVAIDHEDVQGVRVSPHVYTRLSDLDVLVAAIHDIVR